MLIAGHAGLSPFRGAMRLALLVALLAGLTWATNANAFFNNSIYRLTSVDGAFYPYLDDLLTDLDHTVYLTSVQVSLSVEEEEVRADGCWGVTAACAPEPAPRGRPFSSSSPGLISHVDQASGEAMRCGSTLV